MVLGMSAFPCTLVDSWGARAAVAPGRSHVRAVGLQPIMFYTFAFMARPRPRSRTSTTACRTAPSRGSVAAGSPARRRGRRRRARARRALLHLQLFATPSITARARPRPRRRRRARGHRGRACRRRGEDGLGTKDTPAPAARDRAAGDALLNPPTAVSPARRRGAAPRRGQSINDDLLASPGAAHGALRARRFAGRASRGPRRGDVRGAALGARRRRRFGRRLGCRGACSRLTPASSSPCRHRTLALASGGCV